MKAELGAPKGYLHSYETLGTQDGPGLRLVVFLQGCPLRCRCCHNPDSWDFLAGQPVGVEDIVAKARRLKPYFGKAGGITLSGGEPLAQAPFLLSLLKALTEEQIHTVLDTSGSVKLSDQLCRAIISHTDLILLDIKHPDRLEFKSWTGQSMEPLREFLNALQIMGKPVWLRQVIVPGWNDTPEAIESLLSFVREYPDLMIQKIELLGYHTLGVAKYESLGLDYSLKNTAALKQEPLANLQKMIDDAFSPLVLNP